MLPTVLQEYQVAQLVGLALLGTGSQNTIAVDATNLCMQGAKIDRVTLQA